jgi:hypothetical protein
MTIEEYMKIEESKQIKCYCGHTSYCDCSPLDEPKQETLEEAAKSNYDKKTARLPVPTSHWINSEFLQVQNFIEGAKWQAERMYSEEEIFNLCRDFAIFVQQKRPSYKKQLEWFTQFKKQAI